MYDTAYLATDAGLPFPKAPPPATFVNRGYTNKPTFFGCEANLTNTGDLSAPLVVYMPNAPYSSYTNYSWLQESFSHEQMSVILTNGFNYVTQGNSTLDKEWPECLGCAAIDRSLTKVGMERTEQCQRCMTRYCWDGVEDNSNPGVLDLSLRLKPDLSYAEWNKSTTATYWLEVGK
jgi:lysophospholipase